MGYLTLKVVGCALGGVVHDLLRWYGDTCTLGMEPLTGFSKRFLTPERLKPLKVLMLSRPWWPETGDEINQESRGDGLYGVTDGIWGLECGSLLSPQLALFPGETLYLRQEAFGASLRQLWWKVRMCSQWYWRHPLSPHPPVPFPPTPQNKFFGGWNFPSLLSA